MRLGRISKMTLTTSRRMQGMEVGCIGESNTAWPRFGASFCPCGNSRTPNVEAYKYIGWLAENV